MVGGRSSPWSKPCTHSCHTLGTLQALHTGMCSADGWPQDGVLVPFWRPGGCIQGSQPSEDRGEDPGLSPGGEARWEGDAEVWSTNKTSVKRTLLSLVSGASSREGVGGSLSAGLALDFSLGTGRDLGLPVDLTKQVPVVICIPWRRDLGGEWVEDQRDPYVFIPSGYLLPDVNPGLSPLPVQDISPVLPGGSLAQHLNLQVVGVMLGCLP